MLVVSKVSKTETCGTKRSAEKYPSILFSTMPSPMLKWGERRCIVNLSQKFNSHLAHIAILWATLAPNHICEIETLCHPLKQSSSWPYFFRGKSGKLSVLGGFWVGYYVLGVWPWSGHRAAAILNTLLPEASLLHSLMQHPECQDLKVTHIVHLFEVVEMYLGVTPLLDFHKGT